VKKGDLVQIYNHKNPSVFLGWCSEDQPAVDQDLAYLLAHGEIREVSCDWWVPVKEFGLCTQHDKRSL